MENAHPFEMSGLGFAPFTFLHVGRSEGGECDHCGTKIKHRFVCHGFEGPEFVVGSDCIRKLDGRTVEDTLFVRAATKAAVEAERAETEARCVQAWHALQRHKTLLTDQPHPWRRGKTMRDEVIYVMQSRMGWTAKKKSAIAIEKALKHDMENTSCA